MGEIRCHEDTPQSPARPCLVSGLLALASIALGSVAVRADVKLPAVISDHMVAQSDAALPIWGWAEPGEDVTVTTRGPFAGPPRPAPTASGS